MGGAIDADDEDLFLVPGAKDLPNMEGLQLEDHSDLLQSVISHSSHDELSFPMLDLICLTVVDLSVSIHGESLLIHPCFHIFSQDHR